MPKPSRSMNTTRNTISRADRLAPAETGGSGIGGGTAVEAGASGERGFCIIHSSTTVEPRGWTPGVHASRGPEHEPSTSPCPGQLAILGRIAFSYPIRLGRMADTIGKIAARWSLVCRFGLQRSFTAERSSSMLGSRGGVSFRRGYLMATVDG